LSVAQLFRRHIRALAGNNNATQQGQAEEPRTAA
jgi:hypothetical protein